MIKSGNGFNGFVKAFQAMGRLFSLSKGSCVYCKQAADLNPDHLGLCTACYRSIPWVMNVVCAACGRYEACPDCSRRSHNDLEVNRSAVRYDDKMKELLARYKYRGDERLQTVMGGMLVHAWSQVRSQAQARQIANESDTSELQVITYVPVSERRFTERGFNQAEQMARELGRRVGVPVVPLLKRVRHTDKQSFKTRSDRLDDLQHVFDVDEAGILTCTRMRGSFSSVSLYIVDDVYTTGSTMHECAKVLKARLEADCYGVTWAR